MAGILNSLWNVHNKGIFLNHNVLKLYICFGARSLAWLHEGICGYFYKLFKEIAHGYQCCSSIMRTR